MPSCDCHDWKKHHWPCKHFIAIFQHKPEWGWDSLGSGYCQSPMFCIDEQCIAAIDIPEQDQVSLEGFMEINEDHPCVPSENAKQSPSPGTIQDTDLSISDTSRSKTARSCREIMHEISSMTYLCTEEEALRDLQENLRVLRERLQSSIRSDHGLFLTSAGSTVCPKKKKKEKSKPTKYRKLPLRRKKRTRQQAGHVPILKEGEKPCIIAPRTPLTIPTFPDDGIDGPPPKKVCPGFTQKSDNCSARHQHHHVTDQVPDPTTKHNNNSDETTFETVFAISKPPPPSQNPCNSSSSLNMAPIVIDDTSPNPEKWISYKNDELDIDIQLYMVSKVNTLQTSAWLSDTEIHAGQQLLKEQFPFVDGLRYPSIVGDLITPCKSTFVQTMNTGGHWV